jgi:hypothetical protein
VNGKYQTIKEWTIEESKSDDMQITVRDGDVDVRYQIPMEEAMNVVYEVKKLFRAYPQGDYFQMNFGGPQHGFSRANSEKFVNDLRAAISECMARRVISSVAFKNSVKDEPIPITVPGGFVEVPKENDNPMYPDGIKGEPAGIPKPKGTKKK